jgi:hypothetical protein
MGLYLFIWSKTTINFIKKHLGVCVFCDKSGMRRNEGLGGLSGDGLPSKDNVRTPK